MEFGEGELSDLQSIAERLFLNASDPTSPNYQRILQRPKISWVRIGLSWAVPLLISIVFRTLMMWLEISDGWTVGALVLGWGVYALVRMKAALICLVQIYQRYAPNHVRCKCRFEPSCSVYMIQALEKYGVLCGLQKGIGRLRRCKPGFGGFEPLD